ncbi:MAG: Hsp70 family protein, partial [Candidatus Calescibacterium sp.]|nr:Hsp70 family protein [Candidatus Calescibacterium sp.]
MATNITIQTLLPDLIKYKQVPNKEGNIFEKTFIGIDFGTSTTVVSIATIDKNTRAIKAEPIWIKQKLSDGAIVTSEKIPSAIALYNNSILVGQGAADLKYKLEKGKNVWFSFKMELGADLGPIYYNTQLDKNTPYPIYTPKDAAKVFFQYLKSQIDKYVAEKNLPQNLEFAVSIPASFEANQRKDLVEALEQSGMKISNQSLIDEPNAAFLNFIQVSENELNPLILPENDNTKILVFDFGAGTCDISILEIGQDIKGIYSKNLAISKFERLGGDDIDWLIAYRYLLVSLLQENGKKESEFRTSEKKRIITHLLKTAEQLKIMICENIALQMTNRILPANAWSKNKVSINVPIEIDTRKGLLVLEESSLSYEEFHEVMKVFLNIDSSKPYRIESMDREFVSIFNPIQSALKKASLSKKDIDYVLLIGGSSKNPYVQFALKEYFKDSELLVPRDLQTHVSAGAAIHCLAYNGFNKNIIQPITSEPLLVITKDEKPKVILKAGTQIPCDLIVIDDLVTSQDNQKAVELPICVGNTNKLLHNIKIVSNSTEGFRKNTPVKLEIEITTDKLLHVRASVEGKDAIVQPFNPFANKELTTEQRNIL